MRSPSPSQGFRYSAIALAAKASDGDQSDLVAREILSEDFFSQTSCIAGKRRVGWAFAASPSDAIYIPPALQPRSGESGTGPASV